MSSSTCVLNSEKFLQAVMETDGRQNHFWQSLFLVWNSYLRKHFNSHALTKNVSSPSEKQSKTYHGFSVCAQKSEPVAVNKSWLFMLNSSVTSQEHVIGINASLTHVDSLFKSRTHICDLSKCIVPPGSRAFFTSYFIPPWTSNPQTHCGVLRRTCTQTQQHGCFFGFTETSGASRRCHSRVRTQGCVTGAWICMVTSCKTHVRRKQQRCFNKLWDKWIHDMG